MMIFNDIGVGVDVELISRFGHDSILKNDIFLRKIFTDKEIKYCFSRSVPEASFAVRFCGKEAVIKAVNHFGNYLIPMTNIEIINDLNGSPRVAFFDENSKKFHVRLSLSHAQDSAVAFAVVWRN